MHPTLTYDLWQREHEQHLLEARLLAQQNEILEARAAETDPRRVRERRGQRLAVLAPALLAVR